MRGNSLTENYVIITYQALGESKDRQVERIAPTVFSVGRFALENVLEG
jgi:hypothetical protein